MVNLSRDRVPQADFRVHEAGEPFDWLRHGGSYFDVRVIEETWSKAGRSARYAKLRR